MDRRNDLLKRRLEWLEGKACCRPPRVTPLKVTQDSIATLTWCLEVAAPLYHTVRRRAPFFGPNSLLTTSGK